MPQQMENKIVKYIKFKVLWYSNFYDILLFKIIFIKSTVIITVMVQIIFKIIIDLLNFLTIFVSNITFWF